MRSVKFMFIVTTVLSAGFFALTAHASEKDVHISNQSDYELSFQVNGICSNLFGVVPSYKIKTVPEKSFMEACKSNSAPCIVVIYGEKQCQGDALGMVNYYIQQNRVDLYPYSEHVSMSVSDFDLFVNR